MFATGDPVVEEMSFAYPQGNRRQETRLSAVHDDSGVVASVLGVCRDVTGVRNAQKALRQSESLFGAVFDSATDAILLCDDSGRFVAANPAATGLLEEQRESLLRMDIWDFVASEDEGRLRTDWAAGLQRGNGLWMIGIRVHGGKTQRARWFMRVGVVPGLNMLVISRASEEKPPEAVEAPAAGDGSEGEVVEAGPAPAESRPAPIPEASPAPEPVEQIDQRYEEIFASATNGTAILEPIHDFNDFRFTALNDAGGRILSVKPDEVIGRTLRELFPALPDTGFLEALGRVAETGRSERLREFFYSDGRIEFWASNSIFRLLSGQLAVLFDDVTAWRRAEDARRGGEELLRAILSESPEGILVFDAEGRLLDANEASLGLLGVYRVEDFMGMDIFAVPSISGDTKERLMKGETVHMQSAFDFDLLKGIGVLPTRRTGVGFLDLSVAPLIAPDGALQGYVLHLRDETVRKTAEQVLRESEERYRTIFTQSPIGIVAYDREGRPSEVNPSCMEIFGISSPEQFSGFDIFESPALQPEARKALESGAPVRFETRVDFEDLRKVVLPDTGRTGMASLEIWINPLTGSDGSPAGYLAHIIDVTRSRAAEQAAVQGEERYRTLFENAELGIFESTLDNRPLVVNSAFARIFGYASPEEAISSLAEAFDHICADQERMAAAVGEVIARPGPSAFEADCRRSDGGLFLGSLVLQTVRDADGSPLYFFGLVEDITERRKAEEALRESEERFRLVVQTQRELIYRWMPDTTITFANQAFCRFYGMKYEDLLGRKWLDCLSEIERARMEPLYDELSADPRLREMELQLQGPEGHPRWMHWTDVPVYDEDGFLIEFQSSGYDITERREAERALRESEENLRSVFELAPDSIFLADEMGRIIQVNTALSALLGRPREQITSGSVADFFPADLLDRIRQRLSTPSESADFFEGAFVRDDGARIPVELGTQKLMLRGEPVMLAVARDLTDRKRAEEEKRKLENQIQQTQKLECLGVLAGGIAHDFNNLLMVMLGHSNLASRQLPTLSPVRENVREIERAAQRAAELCRQMLAYSGKGRGAVTRVSLRDLIDDMADMLEVSVSKKAVLRVRHADGIPPVDGDASQLRQVIMNLILNASEAVGERSGVISISTGAVTADSATLADAWAAADLAPGLYVYVEVADTGVGMDPETLSSIFDPFFTTKFSGRGLGLAAVLGIVRSHRGAVVVTSEKGRGSVFRVLLPPASGAEPARKAQAEKHAREKALAGTVLLADDEETVRALEKAMLEAIGCTVILAEDGRDAIEVMRSRGSDVDCLLLDLTMPHMNGREAVSELRRLGWETPVVVCTGYDTAEVSTTFEGLDIAAVVQKPFDLNTLGEAVRKALKSGKRR